MQQAESSASVADDGEPFRLPLSAENVAVGRLGRIYRALDRKTGRMLSVECIELADDVEVQDSSAVETLATDIEQWGSVRMDGEGRHVFSYDSVHCSRGRIYLRSPTSVVRTLAAIYQDFGQLHPLAVKQYVYQVVRGLSTLHKNEMLCGGISMSSLLLCGGNILKIAAWFPSAATVEKIHAQSILGDLKCYRSNGSSLTVSTAKALDIRSVAYVMVEMLTGMRVHGSLMEKQNLLSKVTAGSPEHQFLSSLLEATVVEDLLDHSYFSSINLVAASALNTSTQEQQRIIGILTKQELRKSQAMKRQYLQQIRSWQAQFEKKYRRKPKPTDRPAGIVRAQGRCQALSERMQELNNRLATAHTSVYQMTATTAALPSSQPSIGSMQELSIFTQHESDDRTGETDKPNWLHSGKRSPAQKAFLNRFGRMS